MSCCALLNSNNFMILKILTNTGKEVIVEVDTSKTIGSLREQREDQEGFFA